MTASEIIEKCGGVDVVGDAIDGAKSDAVKKWRSNGIPEKHWSVIRGLCPSIRLADLHSANEALRKATA